MSFFLSFLFHIVLYPSLLGRARKDTQRYPKQYIFLPRVSVHTHTDHQISWVHGTGWVVRAGFKFFSPFSFLFSSFACARRFEVLQSDVHSAEVLSGEPTSRLSL